MPHRDEFEDEDDHFDDRPPLRPRQRTNPTWIVLIVFGGLAALGFVICVGLLGWIGARAIDMPPQPAANNAAVIQPASGKEGLKRIYTRDEFKQLVMGKSWVELNTAVGHPDTSMYDRDGNHKTWYYWNRVTEPGTGKLEPVTIEFEKGKVVSVRFGNIPEPSGR